MLAFEDVTRQFGRTRALDSVSFALRPGGLTVLTGGNGAGKTTLLRLAATLDSPTRGRVLVEATDPREDGATARRHVGHLGQEPGLYGALTARENLAFTAAFFGRTADIDTIADRLGATALLDRRARTLSRGERQRVALARALLAGPLVLLDEPTTALDDAGRDAVIRLLKAPPAGTTFLVATHDRALIDAADAMLRLSHGRLEEAE